MLTRYLLPLVAVCTVAFAAVQVVKAQQKPVPGAPPVEPAKSPFAAAVAGAGLVEPETENISIGTHLPGVVERVLVKVGDAVRPGAPLFKLDDRHLQAELQVRQAMLAAAQAGLDKLRAMPRPAEVPPSDAKVAEAKAQLKNATTVYDRLKRIGVGVADDEVTRQDAAVQVARAQLAKAEADLALLKEGAWQPDQYVQSAAVKQAEAQVGQTRTELERLVVAAPRLRWESAADPDPTEFRVLQVNVRPGEYVNNTPGQALIVLGHVGRLHVRVDVDENDIPRFRPNLPGVAKPRGAAGQEFPLTFVRVEPYVIPKRSLTGGNTERVDTRVLQVIYALDTGGRPLYVGQQMDVFLNGEGK
jgi:multidrug efflux pump subunit AcrA (membrane-fusion protein)